MRYYMSHSVRNINYHEFNINVALIFQVQIDLIQQIKIRKIIYIRFDKK